MGFMSKKTKLIPKQEIAGVILAGGRGARMGERDKGLMNYRNGLMIEAVLERFAPQVSELLVSANRSHQAYAALGYPVLKDATTADIPDFSGPLCGIYTALQWSRLPWLACVPCDMPYLPLNLVQGLAANMEDQCAAYASDGRQGHYLCCLLNQSLVDGLSQYLHQGQRAVRHWLRQIDAKQVVFECDASAFRNVNYPEDLTPS